MRRGALPGWVLVGRALLGLLVVVGCGLQAGESPTKAAPDHQAKPGLEIGRAVDERPGRPLDEWAVEILHEAERELRSRSGCVGPTSSDLTAETSARLRTEREFVAASLDRSVREVREYRTANDPHELGSRFVELLYGRWIGSTWERGNAQAREEIEELEVVESTRVAKREKSWRQKGLTKDEGERAASEWKDLCLAAASSKISECGACQEAFARLVEHADQRLQACLGGLAGPESNPARARASCLRRYEEDLLQCTGEPGWVLRVPALAVEPGFESRLLRHCHRGEVFAAYDAALTTVLQTTIPGIGRFDPGSRKFQIGDGPVSVVLRQGRSLDFICSDSGRGSPWPGQVSASWTAVSGTGRVEVERERKLQGGLLTTHATLTLEQVVLRSDAEPTRRVVIPKLVVEGPC